MADNTVSKISGRPKVTALICTRNEADNLAHILPRIPQWVDEILIVDGHSSDRTVEVARELQPDIKVLYQPGKGKGDALSWGFRQASGEIIITLDADGSTSLEDMPRFIEPLLDGYDFAKGSRFLGQSPIMSKLRRLGNRIFTGLTNILYGTKYTDICAGLNAFWAKILQQIDPEGKTPMWEPTINIRLKKRGLKVIEVYQQDKGRIAGRREANPLRQGLRILKIIFQERFHG
jgi:glycosyltransferase involved in cell wall biosynthesis